MKRSLVILIDLVIFSLFSGGIGLVQPVLAQDGGLIVIIDDILVEQFESNQTLQLHVTVRHPQGGAVAKLGPEAFTITVNGRTYVPTQAELKDDADVSLAIVLELYQTMRGEPFDEAKAAIGHLFTTKPSRDRVAFLGVRPDVDPDSDTIDTDYERDFTYDGGGLNNFVQSSLELVKQGSGTPLYDTLIRALRLTAKEPIGRSAIIVITDGGDAGSRYTADAVIDASEELKIPVFSIGYTGNDRPKDQFLNELANRTGGRYQDTPEAADFQQFLDDVRYDMGQHYLLTFKPAPLDSGRQVLEIRVEAGGLMGTHSKHFDIETGSATPSPALPTNSPEPVQGAPDATVEPTQAGSTSEPTATAKPEEEKAEAGGNIVDSVRDNPAVAAAVIGGGLLLIIVFSALIVRLRRRGGQPERAWGSETAPYNAGGALYDTVAQEEVGQAPSPISAPPGAETSLSPQMQPPGSSALPPPVSSFPPAPPMPGKPAPPVDVSAPSEGTLILQRGPRMTRYAMLIDQARPDIKYDLNSPVVGLGRASNNNIVLDSPQVSREHATIKLEQDNFRIFDLGSSNGTFVNDQKVIEPIVLQDGDLVRLGDLILIFKIITLDE